ncbi:hypothetical protein FXO37_28838 [Capsicum annuum]|nr:hypothetical protein FXO37_28838 [Capsicum annuum]
MFSPSLQVSLSSSSYCFPSISDVPLEDVDLILMCSSIGDDRFGSAPVACVGSTKSSTFFVGSDTDWFLSPSLEGLLNPPKSPKKSIMEYPPVSILLGLPNGDLLVIVEENDVAGPDDACYLSLASLVVSRAGQHSLNVTRHFLQSFSVDAPYFVLLDAKAM